MKTQTLKFNELGQKLKTKLLLLCITIMLFSGACKKELYNLNITPPIQQDQFFTELYNSLLKNDSHYHILNQLQPSDKLGWELMMVRLQVGEKTNFNYVVPVIGKGGLSDRLIQFSFSPDNKLVDITLFKYNDNLRMPLASDSLNSNYVKNQQAGNILTCMSKDGLVVNDKLAKSAVGVAPFDRQRIIKDQNLLESKFQTSKYSTKKNTVKSIGTNANLMSFNDGSGCITTVDFDFMFSYSYWDGTYNFNSDNNLTRQNFSSVFFSVLRNAGLDFTDLSNTYRNRISIYGMGQENSWAAGNLIGQALDHAAMETGLYLHFDSFYIAYYRPTVFAECPITGGGPVEFRDVRNNVTDPCLSKAVTELLLSNNNIEGAISDIIKKFDQTKTVSINIFDGEIYYSDNITPKPGQISKQQFIGDAYNASITLGKTFHSGTSKENVVTTLIHEMVHAYLGFSSNNFLKTETDHNVIANSYISPMAEYLRSYFGIPLKEAYALAWSGVPDSKAWSDASMDFEFTMSDGSKITKLETMLLSSPFKDQNNDPYAKGTPICP